MAILSKDQVQALAKENDRYCVSLYMPTHRAGADTQQDPIRLKELLRKAEQELIKLGIRAPEAKERLAPAAELLQMHDFWQFQSDGLALFISPNTLQHFRLPYRFDEYVNVNNRFFIKPLIPLLTGDGRFYVLALSQSKVRLLMGTRYSVDEVYLDNIKGLPRNLAEALKYDQIQEQRHQHDFAGEPTGKWGRTTIFHGQGGSAADNAKVNIRRFFRMVDEGLHEILRNEDAPLVLAGVEYLHPIYREANTYPHLVEGAIEGNPDDLKPEELHARAWKIVEPLFEAPREQALEAFRQLAGEKSERVSDDLRSIVPAAFYGRVCTLFVTPTTQLWGKFDPATDNIQIHGERQKGDEDLFDLAVVQTVLNNGNVFAYDPKLLATRSPAAAVFRY